MPAPVPGKTFLWEKFEDESEFLAFKGSSFEIAAL